MAFAECTEHADVKPQSFHSLGKGQTVSSDGESHDWQKRSHDSSAWSCWGSAAKQGWRAQVYICAQMHVCSQICIQLHAHTHTHTHTCTRKHTHTHTHTYTHTPHVCIHICQHANTHNRLRCHHQWNRKKAKRKGALRAVLQSADGLYPRRSCWEGLGTEFFRKDTLNLLVSDVQYGLWFVILCVYSIEYT